ncbi:MAG: methyltransferase domain-containing protein, partial [Lachnospiraceae bacterium]|nr:methyltransferase domain-containing protein [Lachnospiraceae bacterium]
ILNVGCGNSKLSEDLSEEGYEDITNIDFSTKVITIMEQTYKEKFPKPRNVKGLPRRGAKHP